MSYSVRELDTDRKRTFKSQRNAIAFAASQARGAWVAQTWTVLDNALESVRIIVNEDETFTVRPSQLDFLYR